MSVRRYYLDSYTREFTAPVRELTTVGGRPAAILEETYFYPSSGGQPHDTGWLGQAPVSDVAIRESDGAILHFLEAAPGADPAAARIDWPRRFDHMQQHTGQHILSQAFERVAGAPTIGFHLGKDAVSIDLAAASLGDAQVADAEALANQIVSNNTPVRAWFPEEAELRALALRKQPEVAGPIRVVAIGDFDLSACGGTHVAAAGEVGLIALLRAERLKRGLRIEFLCGGRARADYARKHGILRELSAALTCGPEEVGASVARLQESLQDARRELSARLERELDAEAAALLANADRRGGVRIIRAAWASRPIDQIKGLALRCTEPPGVVVLFGVAGERVQLLFGRSEETTLDLKAAFQRTLTGLGGGKGGGTRMLQGAAGSAGLADLETALRDAEAMLFPAA
ncbi:MAG TPA: alanyl-tRNA editing protein [Gemmatimonadales bacterium]|nr:alanyl-tRNA editing protein [Gemmatimonadales bacterium]